MNGGGRNIYSMDLIPRARILPPVFEVGDESMSAIWFRTTAKGYLPHLSYIFRNLEPLGTEFKTVACSVTGDLLFIEVQRGKEGMKDSRYQKEIGATTAIKGNVRYWKVRRFSSCEFWKNIGCLVSAPTFGLGGSRLWEMEEEQKLSGKKRKRRSIQAKVDLYEVFFYFIYCLLFYFKIKLTPFSLPPDIRYLSH